MPGSNPSAAAYTNPAVRDAISNIITELDLNKWGFKTFGITTPSRMRSYALEGEPVPALEFWFLKTDPSLGEVAGLKRIAATRPGNQFTLTLEIFDGYEPDQYPGRIVQRVSVDGQAVDTHDISAPAFSGWREVSHTFTAKGDQTEICIYLEVVGALESWNWGYASKTIVRRVTLQPAA